MVLVEPGTCNAATYSDPQIATLAKVPMLIIFGDNLSSPATLPAPNWQERFVDCQIGRIGAAVT